MRGIAGETVLGRYRLEAPLAEGGFGEVWRARQVSLDRVVAVKFLRPGRREDPAIRERFRREARLLAGIAHPHVVTCHDFDVDPDGDLVLVMEYLEGRTLLDVFRRREVVPLSRIVQWISQASEGLWEAHARGIVHRDVKPSNLFVADFGSRGERLKVIDFGILRADLQAHPDLEGLTRTGMVVGTPEYLAPEVALGRPAGPSADQYALALVAFEMIGLRKAFPPWEEGGGMARIGGRPEGMDFGFTGRRVPPAVQEVLWRALSPIPEERFGSIREFGEALREAAGLAPGTLEAATRVSGGASDAGEDTGTRATRLEPPRPSAGARRRATVVAGVLAVAFLGGLFLRWASGQRGAGDSPTWEAVHEQAPVQGAVDAGGIQPPGDRSPDGPGGGEGEASGTPGGEGAGALRETGSGNAGETAPGEPVAGMGKPAEASPAGDGRRPGNPARAARVRRDPKSAPRESVPAEAPGGTGRISLNAMPWAQVYLDDRDLGRTPVRELEVPAGDHRVRFVHPTLGEVRRSIRIPAGGTGSLGVDLTAGTDAGP